MGQYYHPMLIDIEGNITLLNPHQYDNGLKLMEHSYIGNNLVNAVLGQIKERPRRVAWIGDYSDGYDGSPYERQFPQDVFMEFYNKAWGYDEKTGDYITPFAHPEPMEYNVESTGWYLVNHTMRCYIDMDAYILRNGWTEEWTDRQKNVVRKDVWCVSPLPLLTACGNGRGGGDYYDCYPDYDKVGTWAFDAIELTRDKHRGFKEVMFNFTEQRKVS